MDLSSVALPPVGARSGGFRTRLRSERQKERQCRRCGEHSDGCLPRVEGRNGCNGTYSKDGVHFLLLTISRRNRPRSSCPLPCDGGGGNGRSTCRVSRHRTAPSPRTAAAARPCRGVARGNPGPPATQVLLSVLPGEAENLSRATADVDNAAFGAQQHRRGAKAAEGAIREGRR